jgi:hypothetical protein
MEGVRMGLTMKEKQPVTRELQPGIRQQRKKRSPLCSTNFTCPAEYHRTYATRLLSHKLVKEVLIYADGEAVQFKPEKKRSANRTGKRVYTDAVIATLRPVWTFFWYICGKFLAPLMRQQMRYIAGWPAFHLTEEPAEKLKKINPRVQRPVPEKDKMALKVKGKRLTPPCSLKSRISHTDILHF